MITAVDRLLRMQELKDLTDPRNWSLGTADVCGKQGASVGAGADLEAVIAVREWCG